MCEIGDQGPPAAAARENELADNHGASKCSRGATAAAGAGATGAAAGVSAAGVGVGEAGSGSGPGTVVRAIGEGDERAVFADTFDFELAIGNGQFHKSKQRAAGSAGGASNNR